MELQKDIKILLAEDNKINQQIVVFTLKQLQLKCDIACNGKEAFEMVQLKRYDLILMDIQMPVKNGFEATRLIREFEKETCSPHRAYIIALSANVISEKRQECIEAGMDDFMEKPIQKSMLQSFISQFGTDHNNRP